MRPPVFAPVEKTALCALADERPVLLWHVTIFHKQVFTLQIHMHIFHIYYIYRIFFRYMYIYNFPLFSECIITDVDTNRKHRRVAHSCAATDCMTGGCQQACRLNLCFCCLVASTDCQDSCPDLKLQPQKNFLGPMKSISVSS